MGSVGNGPFVVQAVRATVMAVAHMVSLSISALFILVYYSQSFNNFQKSTWEIFAELSALLC